MRRGGGGVGGWDQGGAPALGCAGGTRWPRPVEWVPSGAGLTTEVSGGERLWGSWALTQGRPPSRGEGSGMALWGNGHDLAPGGCCSQVASRHDFPEES